MSAQLWAKAQAGLAPDARELLEALAEAVDAGGHAAVQRRELGELGADTKRLVAAGRPLQARGVLLSLVGDHIAAALPRLALGLVPEVEGATR